MGGGGGGGGGVGGGALGPRAPHPLQNKNCMPLTLFSCSALPIPTTIDSACARYAPI